MSWESDKKNLIITTYKEFLGTCIKLKKNSIYAACINKSTVSKLAPAAHLHLQHVKKSLPDMYSSPTLLNKFPRTNMKNQI